MSKPDRGATEGTTGEWSPVVGGRVTMTYPEGFGVNFPKQRVGTILELDERGGFHVCCQPGGDLTYVDPRNYEAYGCSYRCWSVRDGWPVDRSVSRRKADDVKKKRRR